MERGGNFTELPRITMPSSQGLNARFVPVFEVIRDPQPIEPEATDVVQVYDLVGLNVQGWVDGKVYYGNVFYINETRYAGTSSATATRIRVYDTRSESIKQSTKADETLQ